MGLAGRRSACGSCDQTLLMQSLSRLPSARGSLRKLPCPSLLSMARMLDQALVDQLQQHGTQAKPMAQGLHRVDKGLRHSLELAWRACSPGQPRQRCLRLRRVHPLPQAVAVLHSLQQGLAAWC